jgi:glycosyltransferase involved in cell wall biosynthesis
MDVLFVVLDGRTRASTRYRALNFIPYLEEENISVTVISIRDVRAKLISRQTIDNAAKLFRLPFQAKRYDLVFVQKVLFPPMYTQILARRSEHIVFDFDDALYTSPQWEDDKRNWSRQLKTMLNTVDLTITGSPVLTEYADRFAKTTATLPTALPREPYDRHRRTEYNNDGSIKLGWIGNPENLHYLAAREDTITSVLNKYDSVSLRIITAGDLPIKPFEDRRGKDVEYVEWSLETEVQLLSEVDIGIRPLFDDEWTRGKGGFTSVVQCMALGLPVVVTPVGMLSDLVENGTTGYHAYCDDDWSEAISDLINNPERRERFGEAAWDAVNQKGFWLEDRAQEFMTVLFERVMN